MRLIDVVHRRPTPRPWEEGDKIPWNEPGFSQRMLREHLAQEHDAASRRPQIIDAHVDWIHRSVLGGRTSDVLDLGCGPGLYVQRLALKGHRCTGVDFGPASIAYARERAAAEGLRCTYHEADIRNLANLPLEPVDLVMLVYGEFNVFRREDAEQILASARRLLRPGGQLLLEPHTFELVRQVGEAPAAWHSSPSGLFSEGPYLLLTENHWDAEAAVAIERYYVVDAANGEVTRYASSMQAYTKEDYAAMLQSAGFSEPRRYGSLTGSAETEQPSLFALVASTA